VQWDVCTFAGSTYSTIAKVHEGDNGIGVKVCN
jgi:hypothetical protein